MGIHRSKTECDMNDTGLCYDAVCELDLVSAARYEINEHSVSCIAPLLSIAEVGDSAASSQFGRRGRPIFSPSRCRSQVCQAAEKTKFDAPTGTVNSAVSLRRAYEALLPQLPRSRHHCLMKRRTRTTCLAFTLGTLALLARGQNLAPLSPAPSVEQAAEQQSTLPELTLEQAVEQAVANNSSLKTASLETRPGRRRSGCEQDETICEYAGHCARRPTGYEAIGYLPGRLAWGIQRDRADSGDESEGRDPAKTRRHSECPGCPAAFDAVPAAFAIEGSCAGPGRYATGPGENASGGGRPGSTCLLRGCRGTERFG